MQIARVHPALTTEKTLNSAAIEAPSLLVFVLPPEEASFEGRAAEDQCFGSGTDPLPGAKSGEVFRAAGNSRIGVSDLFWLWGSCPGCFGASVLLV